ncbi:hypothetical protein AVEN_230896-1 [Araneus ventricosus]|uniref:Uncharacterized protein n=1 Tax=Araneus ventricosus TaxID=182803 RepID=A0A4Y2A347_ARAVE|nr:hypothetical protein AVEN_230896-1 [Araneus ventricosus]
MSIDDRVHGPVAVTCAVSKKLVSDLLLSTAAYEALRENMQMHEFESTLDCNDCYDTIKNELEVPFVDVEASIELISTESGDGSTKMARGPEPHSLSHKCRTPLYRMLGSWLGLKGTHMRLRMEF